MSRSRRQFLTTAGVAAGAASLAPHLSFAAPKRSRSANERLRVAILGLRNRGQNHIEGFADEAANCDIVAVCDPDGKLVQSNGVEKVRAKTGKAPKPYTNSRECIEADDVDVVSIATPNHWHALQTVWAVQAGKDVYVEKPVSFTVEEGRRMTQAARQYDKVVQYGAQCRTMKGTREMVEFVLGGGIGDVTFARGLCYKRRKSIGGPTAQPLRFPKWLDRNEWTGPAADEDLFRPEKSSAGIYNPHYDWHWDFNTGNGDIGNQGIHQMDVCRWALGVDGLGETVMSYGGRLGYEDAGNTPNTQVSDHLFAGGKRLVFETRGLETDAYKGSKIGAIITGTDGYAVQYGYGSSAAFSPDGKRIREFKGGSTQDHFDNFLEAVRSRDRTILNADIEDGHYSSALCHLGNISYLTGEPKPAAAVREALPDDEARATFDRTAEHLGANGVDLSDTPLVLGPTLRIDGERFTGPNADAANALTTREYRGEFTLPTEAQL